jgi:hypothetical protein
MRSAICYPHVSRNSNKLSREKFKNNLETQPIDPSKGTFFNFTNNYAGSDLM